MRPTATHAGRTAAEAGRPPAGGRGPAEGASGRSQPGPGRSACCPTGLGPARRRAASLGHCPAAVALLAHYRSHSLGGHTHQPHPSEGSRGAPRHCHARWRRQDRQPGRQHPQERRCSGAAGTPQQRRAAAERTCCRCAGCAAATGRRSLPRLATSLRPHRQGGHGSPGPEDRATGHHHHLLGRHARLQSAAGLPAPGYRIGPGPGLPALGNLHRR